MATASNSSLVCATTASSTIQSRVVVAAALADNDPPDSAPRFRRWSLETSVGALRAPFYACSLEGALRFTSRRRPPKGVAGEGNGLCTTTRGPLPVLCFLGCGRFPGPEVIEFPCVMLLPRLPGGGGFPRARPPPSRPAFYVADAPHEHRHINSRALPGRHSFNACTSHVPAEI